MSRNDATVTLIGQSKSGKTHYLAALLNHPARVHDLLEGQNAVDSAVLEMLTDEDEDRRMDRESLVTHYSNILQGKDSFQGRNEGTDKARSYRARLELARSVEGRRGLLGGRTTSLRKEITDFAIVDGRGGDLAPNQYDQDVKRDEVFQKRRREYREAVIRSTGLVICLTIAQNEYDAAMGARLLDEFRLACELKQSSRDGVPFRNIALCLTKYETVMQGDGNLAGLRARERDDFLDIARQSAGVGQFAELLRRGGFGGDFRTAVFPVSTFGFVNRTGAANWYDYPWAAGLRTRAVEEYDYDNDELPGYRDHFPHPVSQQRALNMWQPFNLAPPMVFALTGRLTGPLHATIEDFNAA